MIIKPSFHVWLAWYDIDMLAGQHHLTVEEIQEAVDLYIRTTKEKDLIVVAPVFDQTLVRAGTPVECL